MSRPPARQAAPTEGLAKKINWNLLHMFVVVAEMQSISRAATVLGRGQPAISAALKKLEERLGTRLAARGPTNFALTPAGEVLYREAREIANGIDRMSLLIADLSGDLTGTVHLAMASHMTSPLLNDAFAEFHRRHPKATFLITVMSSPEIMKAMASSTIHFAITPLAQKPDAFDCLQIFREHCAFYCGPTHRLFGRRDLTAADLRGEASVSYYRPTAISYTLQTIADAHADVQLAEPAVAVSNHMEEVRRMIVAGIGIGAIPIHIAARDERDGLLWRLPPYKPTMPVDVFMITNPRVRPSRVEQALIDVIQEMVAARPLKDRTYPQALGLPFTPISADRPRAQKKRS
ncbi:LysR family transcriptional regulator [Reyranella sp.]|uniref:LysR family transcriptional regulator n=1 Tax=Reyranella sp. TaxID=1929291 RepID=UPI003BABFF75